MKEKCRATRELLLPFSGSMRCKRLQWGGTDYCYQHAISHGAAIVITPTTLIRAMQTTGPDRTFVSLWTELGGKINP